MEGYCLGKTGKESSKIISFFFIHFRHTMGLYDNYAARGTVHISCLCGKHRSKLRINLDSSQNSREEQIIVYGLVKNFNEILSW